MQIIPKITLKERQIAEKQKEFLKKLPEDETVYLHDFDGIQNDKPDLCIYQKLSKKYDIWVDSAPRDSGDVVDIFLTGATAVTLRKKYSPQIDIKKIREISENKIYNYLSEDENIYENTDGMVIIKEKQESFDFKTSDLVKRYSKTQNVFIYEPDVFNTNYWLNSDITGLLVDIEHYEAAKKWILKKKSL